MNLNSENELRDLFENQMAAIRKKDIDTILPFYSENVIQFDVVNPLQNKGTDGIKKEWKNGWFFYK